MAKLLGCVAVGPGMPSVVVFAGYMRCPLDKEYCKQHTLTEKVCCEHFVEFVTVDYVAMVSCSATDEDNLEL